MPGEINQTEEAAQLEGFISVTAALQGGHRQVHGIQLRQGKEDAQTRHLQQIAQKSGVPVQRVSAEEIERRAGGKTHGGVLAQVGPYQFSPLDTLAAEKTHPFIAMIDGVEDPFNFGASVRALYAAGADGLVLRPRNWLSAAGIVARASAGRFRAASHRPRRNRCRCRRILPCVRPRRRLRDRRAGQHFAV